LKVAHLKPGAQVSVDRFESRLLGQTFDSYGKATSDTFKGGCIFVDHSSGFMFVEHQLCFSAVETIRAKHAFEALSLMHGVLIESYLTDSGAFKKAAFVNQIRKHGQRIRYCGANAYDKNSVVERAVMSVSNMACAMLLHASNPWKNGIDALLWPMAVQYATHQYNHLPNAQGLCPADHFTGSTIPCHGLRDIHVWGCPVYVLDPQLQEGKKLARWQPRSRRGVFVGFSTLHSSDVPLVLNLQTGSITPQHHVVFDDHFSIVSSVERETDPPEHWADLCLEQSTYIPTDDGEHGAPTSAFLLDDNWLTPEELEVKGRSTTRQNAIRATFDEEMLPNGTNAVQPAVNAPRHEPADDAPDLVSKSVTTQQREQALRPSHGEPLVQQQAQRKSSAPQREFVSTTSASSGLSTSRAEPSGLSSSPSPFRRSARSNKGVFRKPDVWTKFT
jgi:hypothetical protein